MNSVANELRTINEFGHDVCRRIDWFQRNQVIYRSIVSPRRTIGLRGIGKGDDVFINLLIWRHLQIIRNQLQLGVGLHTGEGFPTRLRNR